MSKKRKLSEVAAEDDFVVEDEVHDNSDDDIPLSALQSSVSSAKRENEKVEAVKEKQHVEETSMAEELTVEDELVVEDSIDDDRDMSKNVQLGIKKPFKARPKPKRAVVKKKNTKTVVITKCEPPTPVESTEEVHKCEPQAPVQPTEEVQQQSEDTTANEQQLKTENTSDNEATLEGTELNLEDFEVVDEVEGETTSVEISEGHIISAQHAEAKAEKHNDSNHEESVRDSQADLPSVHVDETPAVVQRTEPLPEVLVFAESLTKVVFDWKKYTCFYCNPCQLYFTDTVSWHVHLEKISHKKTLHRWRIIQALQNEPTKYDAARQKMINSCNTFIAGADKILELPPTSSVTRPRFICVLCNFLCTDMENILRHLADFNHIDNYMEYVSAYLYKPPTINSLPADHKGYKRKLTAIDEKQLREEARKNVLRYGRGRIKTLLAGAAAKQDYGDWFTVDPNQAFLEDVVLRHQMKQFLTDAKVLDVKMDLLTSDWSAVNREYESLTSEDREKYLGLQYLVELWAPSRRVIAVWYCALCDSLALDWQKHCDTVQHVACYLKKDYAAHLYDDLLKEADDEDDFRRIVKVAQSKVARFEGFACRVRYVVQVQKLLDVDYFVALNAKIAKQLIDYHHLVFEPICKSPEKCTLGSVRRRD